MSRKLNDFISKVKNTGVAHKHLYTVSTNLPNSLRDRWNIHEVDDFMLMCSNASLPDFSVLTSPIKTYGIAKEMPYEKSAITFTLGFYVLADFRIKHFFEDWQKSVFNPETGFFGFYNDYTTDIRIQMESPERVLEYDVTMIQCYPKTVQQIELSSSAEATAMSLSVEFVGLKWKRNNINVKH